MNTLTGSLALQNRHAHVARYIGSPPRTKGMCIYQGCQHCDIEKQETPNFIVRHACAGLLRKKRAYLVSTSKKDFTQNRETPGKSVELVTLIIKLCREN